ncbi:MAG: fumarylacetoacetate hydrolase family protein [Candidatus Omnitrophota bacterium]|nr:fumarylacetoacetate hydrolase family protein [Candidatus Omnitrophota bacterium]
MKRVKFLHDGCAYNGVLNGDAVYADAPCEGAGQFDLGRITLLAPVEPSKIVLVGLNYRDHARELGMPVPEEPIIFLKPPTAVIGPSQEIFYPGCSFRVDYEAELGVVIKDRIRGIGKEEAADHIAGYTCLNDVTARDLQKKDTQWSRAKSFDTFAPVGPWIETDLDPSDLRICSYLNGELKQDSRTSEFVFSVPELVEFISGIMTLLPGDVIATGTPPGTGPMNPGDEVVIEIEGIGRLANRVCAGKV